MWCIDILYMTSYQAVRRLILAASPLPIFRLGRQFGAGSVIALAA